MNDVSSQHGRGTALAGMATSANSAFSLLGQSVQDDGVAATDLSCYLTLCLCSSMWLAVEMHFCQCNPPKSTEDSPLPEYGTGP